MTDGIVEGVFAIHKPQHITSAQVVREVQGHFNPSKLFQPWIQEETARLKEARKHAHKQRFRKSKDRVQVKIGHGGTLDPMATGILVLGIGAGTKRLEGFQKNCTKTYETVVLFGQATDTYDVLGKTVARKAFDHITEEKVRQALEDFKGESMQKPPLYSALRMNGKRLYEYAREGKDIPKEIEQRPVTVHELEFVEWLEGGSHQYHWPKEEAEEADKRVAEKILRFGPQVAAAEVAAEAAAEGDTKGTVEAKSGSKRAREDDVESSAKRVRDDLQPESEMIPAANEAAPREPCPAPACRIRMTVTSGFYVRSLCHDLGQALDSHGTMAALVRTKQAEFELGKNVLEFEELIKGEEVWAPQVVELMSKSASHTES